MLAAIILLFIAIHTSQITSKLRKGEITKEELKNNSRILDYMMALFIIELVAVIIFAIDTFNSVDIASNPLLIPLTFLDIGFPLVAIILTLPRRFRTTKKVYTILTILIIIRLIYVVGVIIWSVSNYNLPVTLTDIIPLIIQVALINAIQWEKRLRFSTEVSKE